VLVFVGLDRGRPARQKIFDGSFVFLFGIAGAVALLLQRVIKEKIH
jgi:hypothetical protein